MTIKERNRILFCLDFQHFSFLRFYAAHLRIKRLLTIKAIAKDTTFSVSKALNDRHHANENPKHCTHDIAKQHNFRPAAHIKRQKKPCTVDIGVTFFHESKRLSANPFYSPILIGCETELLYNFIPIMRLSSSSKCDDLPKMLCQSLIDGMILKRFVAIFLYQCACTFTQTIKIDLDNIPILLFL